MSDNSRFTVAIHILTLIAYCSPKRHTSAYIAGSINTNPVVVRRLLGTLRADNLVSSKGGPGGGWQLERPPKKITLGDVFRAFNEAALFPLHPNPPNKKCPVGKVIQDVLLAHFNDAQSVLEKQLDHTTIADLVAEVK